MATTRPLTVEDLLSLEDGCRYDLIRGELIRMSPAGWEHGQIALRIGRYIDVYVDENELGGSAGAETGFILARDPDTMLAPDVAFVRAERLPPGPTEKGFLPLAPDLVVEIVSPSDRSSAVTDKVMTYLDAGVTLVWIVDPEQRVVTVYDRDDNARIVREDGSLDGGDVLPGFTVPVRKIFTF